MNYQDELRLSFYQEIADIDKRHNVVLVQHADTGRVYVKKTLTRYDRSVYEYIRQERFPGIPVIEELIESEGTLTVIEDHINGRDLDELLESKTFSPEETIELISGLCDILAPLHRHDPPIIHRDIKCSNILIDNEGDLYLIDFDASRKVSGGRKRDTDLMGTEEYAAPEQYGFGQSDQRTDIYALGILTHKLLTGRFPSETDYRGEFSHIIAKATALDPENRYQNIQMLKSALQAHRRSSTDGQPGEEAFAWSRLPYLIRQLPGFRSGRLSRLIPALAWYAFMIVFSFFLMGKGTDFTPGENRFYNILMFFVMLVPTLYLGNYLGIRGRLPWKPAPTLPLEILRVLAGTLASLLAVFIAAAIVATFLGY